MAKNTDSTSRTQENCFTTAQYFIIFPFKFVTKSTSLRHTLKPTIQPIWWQLQGHTHVLLLVDEAKVSSYNMLSHLLCHNSNMFGIRVHAGNLCLINSSLQADEMYEMQRVKSSWSFSHLTVDIFM